MNFSFKSAYAEEDHSMKRAFFILLAGFMTLNLAGCAAQVSQEGKDMTETAENSTVYDMEFHRGGRDARPENTLYSYQYALEYGASTIECDMQLSRDGVLVMSHNPVLNPEITVDEAGNRVEKNTYFINEMTVEEIQAFNVGRMDQSTEYYDLHGKTQIETDAFIPTLRQLFELVRDSGNENIRMSIEAKSYPDPDLGALYEKRTDPADIVRAFYDLVKEFGFEKRVVLQSFDWKALVLMEELDPAIETIALYSEEPSWGGADSTTLWLDRKEPSPWLAGLNIHDFDDDPVKAAHSLGIDHVSPYFEEIDEALVKEAHEFGMKVVPWTVNDVKDMENMYRMGVDGIITDRPWILRAFLEQNGVAVPAITSYDLPYHLDGDHTEAETKTAEGGRDAAY